jgi:hypothetical protein
MNRSNKYETNVNNFNVTSMVYNNSSTQNLYLLQSYLKIRKQVILIKI